MDDSISRRAAINVLIELSVQRDEWDSKEGFAQKRGIDASICAIEDLPSTERRGRWIVKHGVLAGDGIYGDMGECSVCGLHLRNYEWDYCPNCGAQMGPPDEE